MDLSRTDTMKRYIQHTFHSGPSSAPESIEVNGRKGRRAICVVTEDRTHYRIFDLDPPKVENGLDNIADPNEVVANESGHMVMAMDSGTPI